MDEEIERVAKHESLHLLLARLTGIARARFVVKEELEEATEETIRKLEKIIQ